MWSHIKLWTLNKQYFGNMNSLSWICVCVVCKIVHPSLISWWLCLFLIYFEFSFLLLQLLIITNHLINQSINFRMAFVVFGASGCLLVAFILYFINQKKKKPKRIDMSRTIENPASKDQCTSRAREAFDATRYTGQWYSRYLAYNIFYTIYIYIYKLEWNYILIGKFYYITAIP